MTLDENSSSVPAGADDADGGSVDNPDGCRADDTDGGRADDPDAGGTGCRRDVFPTAGQIYIVEERVRTRTRPVDRHMLRARIRMALSPDTWVHDVSTSHPEARLRLLTGVPMGDRALELGEVQATPPDPVSDAIEGHPDVHAYERLFADGTRTIAQYEVAEQRLYEFLWSSSLPPEFPILVTDGAMEFDLTATQEGFDAVGAALDDAGYVYELLSLVHTVDGDALLTDRQRRYLTEAHRRGYFEVPRGCTLGDIAETFDVDRSSVSETLRRANSRIVDRYVLGRE